MKIFIATVFVIFGSHTSQCLWAQESSSLALEEVIVSAQRRSQSLQDVPISISVVNADDLIRNSIFDFTETAQLTPGVTLTGGSAALASITVRGVGPGFFAPTAQSVPVFVDQVAAAQPGVVFNTMVDVERIELLRGPQGTLYGKNAPSGAYNITTVAPSFDGTEGFVNGTYSLWDANNEPTVDFRGAVNAPITDTFAARLAGVYAKSEGGIAMESPFASNDSTGGKDHQSLRVRLLWEPSYNTRVNLISNYQDLEDNYSLRLFDGLVPATGGSNPVGAIYTNFSDRADFSSLRSNSTTKVKDVALHYEWAGDLTNVDMIVAYQDFDTTLFQNQNSIPTVELQYTDFSLNTKQTTLELRASNSNDQFDYITGIYLIDTDSHSDTVIDVSTPLPAEVSEKTFGAAVYGNFTYHLAKRWDLSAGLRYDDNSQDYKSFVDLAGFTGDLDETLNFDHLSWSLKLNYFVNDATTAYLAIDNAYRQGGLNAYAPGVNAVGETLENPPIVDTANTFLFYDEEIATSYEVGLKGNALDNRARYSLAVFYQQYDDHIIRQNDPTAEELQVINALYTLMFVNAEDVVTSGVEFDITYLFSERWTLDFRSAYFNAQAEEWQDRLCTNGDGNTVDVYCPITSGTDLSNLPKINTNTQISYFLPMESGWNLFSTLSWTWQSEAAINSDVTRRYNDPQNYLNLNLGFAKDAYSIIFWGKNLTDEQLTQTPDDTANGDPNLTPALTARHNNGLQYGLTLGYNF
jgi:iron complex outermembrane recepter protein